MAMDKRIEIRLSESEYRDIEIQAEIAKLNKSDYIRTRLFRENAFVIDKKGMLTSLTRVQKIVNEVAYFRLESEDANALQKEMNNLWRYLK